MTSIDPSSAKPFVLYDNLASVAAQKVRMTLAEKQLSFTKVPIDLRNGEVMRPEYLALNPRGVVPTLVHGSKVLTESSVIIEYLDDLMPQPALRPPQPLARAHMRGWMRRVDDDIHRATGNVSMAIFIRHAHLSKTQADRDAYFATMPDRERAARQQASIAAGLDTPAFGPSLQLLAALVDDIERALSSSDWLAGDMFSLAEIAVSPYITRLDMLALSALWEDGRRPAFARWWHAVQARPSWQREVRDAFPAKSREVMLARGREAWPRVASILGLA
ncbi:MAG: glutathione S-transferase family protein [Burkholderiaceae bacterium]